MAAVVNGLHRQAQAQAVPVAGRYGLGDLGCCGCEQSGPVGAAGGGFDLSSIPKWAWLVAAGVGAVLILKKK